MSEYNAPLADIRFALSKIAGLDNVLALDGFEDLSPDLIDAVLDEAGKFAGGEEIAREGAARLGARAGLAGEVERQTHERASHACFVEEREQGLGQILEATASPEGEARGGDRQARVRNRDAHRRRADVQAGQAAGGRQGLAQVFRFADRHGRC